MSAGACRDPVVGCAQLLEAVTVACHGNHGHPGFASRTTMHRRPRRSLRRQRLARSGSLVGLGAGAHLTTPADAALNLDCPTTNQLAWRPEVLNDQIR